jgi:quercetin dioxygenase-like cupin family protein
MEQQEFLDILEAEGYAAPVLVRREPDGKLVDHAHPFEAKALVLKGEVRIHAGGEIKIYRAGDVFHLRRDEPHRESYGPDGVEYLSGRR